MHLIEWLVLALTYTATGGAVFTDWGKNHRALGILAGIVAIVMTGYFYRDRYLEYWKFEPHVITADITTIKFFDPSNSNPRVWYLKSPAGAYTLYDGPGFDPISGAALQAITPEIAQDLVAKAFAAKADEQRRAEEAQAARQQEINRQAAAERQREQDAQASARAAQQATKKAAQDEIDRQNAASQQKLQQQRQLQEQQQRQAQLREQQQNEWRRTHNGCNLGMRWACFDCQRTNAPECIHIGGNGGCLCVPN